MYICSSVPHDDGDLRRQRAAPDRGVRHEGRLPEDRALLRLRRRLRAHVQGEEELIV